MSLAHQLDRWYGNVRALHEPRPSRRLRVDSNRFLCGRLSRPQMVERLVRARRGLLAATGEPIYVESNNFLHGFLGVLDDVFGEPFVLHVVRDPRTYIRSWINFGVYTGLKGLVGRVHPYWLLKPERLAPAGPLRWNQMHPYVRIGWYWTAINRHLDRGADLFGPRYLRLRFEDLFSPQGNGLERFLQWFGLEPNEQMSHALTDQKVNRSSRNECPAWSQWPQDVRDEVLRQCGPLMETYGYDLDKPPGGKS